MANGLSTAQYQPLAAPAFSGAKELLDQNELLKEAHERFSLALAWDRKNRDAAFEDTQFCAGDQWDSRELQMRRLQKRPTLTINGLKKNVAQISGEVWKNPPGIQITPGDGAATPRGAEVHAGMIRAIERDSGARYIYANASGQQATGGMSHFRLRIVRERTRAPTRNRVLRIEAIPNPWAVLWDPQSTELDYGDARYCFVYTEMSEKDFKAKYPNAPVSSYQTAKPFSNLGLTGFKTSGSNGVVVCEYWVVKEEEVPGAWFVHDRPGFDPDDGTYLLPTGEEAFVEYADEEAMADAQMRGFSFVQEDTWTKRTICSYVLSGMGVLEGPIPWPGERIPVFTARGKELHLGDEIVRYGIIRDAKDPQRGLNYYVSKDVELHAQAPIAPWMVPLRAVQGLQPTWDTLSTVPRPWVPFIDRDEKGEIEKPFRQDPVPTNPGLMAGAQAFTQYIKDTTGIYDASLGNRSNETSGVAIEARNAQADTGTYEYIARLGIAIRAMGREMVVVWPKVYDAARQIRILGQDDAPAILDLERLKAEGVELDAAYDVEVKIGPAFETQREEIRQGLIDLHGAQPDVGKAKLAPKIIRLMDFHGAEQIADELEQTYIAAGLIPPPPGMAPPGMPPGMPMMAGAPPPLPGGPMPPGPIPPGADIPPNILPFPPRGGAPLRAPPPGALPFPPPGAPAPRQRVGPPNRVAGMSGAFN